MIPTASDVRVESTLRGHDVQMSIDQGALTHIMGILTDLYADSELAIVREYATNALDAHIFAGVSRPIEVTTPTSLNPVFRVRDFGEGLDTADIEGIYSRYGVSTKRASNDAVGMLGLGCKSALAYVDQFTLTGIKNGIRTVVSVSRDADGIGTMTVLETSETDEPSGVEVSIPAKRQNSLAAKAKDFFSYWDEGTVLLDGESPERISGYQLNERMTVLSPNRSSYNNGYGHGYHTGNCRVVMGNVAYTTNLPDLELPYGHVLVVKVPIGTVQFAPSRESLQDTTRTKEALREITAEFNTESKAAVQRDVDKGKTYAEAAQLAIEAGQALGFNFNAINRGGQQNLGPSLTYKGKPLPSGIDIDQEKTNLWQVTLPAPVVNAGRRGSNLAIHSLGISDVVSGAWVLNFPNKIVSAVMQRKLQAYCKAHNIDLDSQAAAYWTDLKRVPMAPWSNRVIKLDWPTVKAWRDPNAPKAARSVAGINKYQAIDTEGLLQTALPADEIDTALPIIYSETHDGFSTHIHQAVSESLGKLTFVQLNANRVNKFKKLFPSAVSATEARKKAAKVWWKKLPKDKRTALAVMHSQQAVRYARNEQCLFLDHTEVNDPELATSLRCAKSYDGKLAAAFSQHRPFLPEDVLNFHCSLNDLVKRYPLLFNHTVATQNRTERINEHLLIYVNTVFAADSETEKPAESKADSEVEAVA